MRGRFVERKLGMKRDKAGGGDNPGIFLVMLLTIVFSVSCATGERGQPTFSFPGTVHTGEDGSGTGPAVGKAAAGESFRAAASLEKFKDFRIFVLPNPDTSCEIPGGEKVYCLSREHELQLVLRFSRPVARQAPIDNLAVYIEGFDRPVRFEKPARTDTDLITPTIPLLFLPENAEQGPAPVELYYEDGARRELLGAGERVAIDNIAPPAPSAPELSDIGPTSHTVSWNVEGDPSDIQAFLIVNVEDGNHTKVKKDLKNMRAVLKGRPGSHYRIVSVDCADNRSEIDFYPSLIEIDAEGCGSSAEQALKEAQNRLRKKFIEERVHPWLAGNASTGPKNWAPPPIERPRTLSESRVTRKGHLWCARIYETMELEEFEAWIAEKAKKFETRGRNTVAIQTLGPGAGVVADLFKSRAAGMNLKAVDASPNLDFSPRYTLKVQVDPGKADPLGIQNMFCWHVRFQLELEDRRAGTKIRLTEKDLPEMDNRVFGFSRISAAEALDDAFENDGPNGFLEKAARHAASKLFERMKKW